MNKKNPYVTQVIPFVTIAVAVVLLLFFSYLANAKLTAQQDETAKQAAMEAFSEIQSKAEQEHPELNHNYSIWEEEIIYLRDNLEDDSPELFNYIAADEWYNSLTSLVQDITTSYYSDEEIAAKIISIIPKECQDTAYSKYMQSFELYLYPGLFTETK